MPKIESEFQYRYFLPTVAAQPVDPASADMPQGWVGTQRTSMSRVHDQSVLTNQVKGRSKAVNHSALLVLDSRSGKCNVYGYGGATWHSEPLYAP